MVSEAGSGYTWALNSRENKLTPWSNDPVGDPAGEALYVRDEESGELFGPTALPLGGEDGVYTLQHGQGYSRFQHESGGIGLELTQFVPLRDPLKISRLVLRNHSGRGRKLSVTAYAEWVLGVERAASSFHTRTELDPQTRAIFARNRWNPEFAERVAFADLGGRQQAWTADRREFLGPGGSPARPAALLAGATLLGASGAGLDPCAVLQAAVQIPAGGQAEVVFLLGQAGGAEQARELIGRYRGRRPAEALEEVQRSWDETLGKVQVTTPDRGLDVLLNRWLLYQTLSSRVWGRSGFYQAGGAYGFRDQLQDVMALSVSRPEIAREHLLRAAARQFPEGDVQHWWHPPSGRGVRTRISDDRLWLPYALDHYLEVTGDAAVLEEQVPFLEGPPVPAGHEDLYFEPAVSGQGASLFEHAARALECSLGLGPHGLPLIGGGDWNDGLNRVGLGGRGESVWLAWFLHANLEGWSRRAEARGEGERARVWRAHLGGLEHALEKEGWDGDWYRRAFFDDGTPLGSAHNAECRIDAIAQSWAVLSGAAPAGRAARAMASLEEHLVRRDEGLVLLLTPPFDRTPQDPGYIKGYLPGVRENGGQYTHAAIWSAMAFAALGDGDRAGGLLGLLNPVHQTSSRTGVQRYKAEPYAMAADVYAEPPHVGRGGWSWYTGSAGWMYRAGLEGVLGFYLRGQRLRLDPCIPKSWPGYRLVFRYRAATYEISVENPQGVSRGVVGLELDGVALSGNSLRLSGEPGSHRVRLVLGMPG
ncbi:Cellobiose phosphorylase [Calidithermus terrae]|uniref:Cellobiose phosphorylase n=1 Tax=Calidithermus terrae TaxID=1408545 RepID=A0A399EC28_9DEIN|nr:Cellobiose phosphorylase [Calidithermus terrae]